MVKTQQNVGIRELAEYATQHGAYDLAQGVIDAAPPTELLKALTNLDIASISSYDNKRGVQEYREAISRYLSSRGWHIEIDHILATAGAMGGISSALLTELRLGATVLLPEPFFVYHKLILETLGFNIEFIPTSLDAQPDWNDIEQRMHNADAIIITTPSNPTGQVASTDTLKQLSDTASKKDCLLIIDEMYREFIWNEEKPDDSSYQQLNFEKTVLLRSFSKTYAIPGWRVAFAITSPNRVENMAIRHDALYVGGSTIAQHALAATLTNNLNELHEYVVILRTQLQENMKRLTDAFTVFGMNPSPVPATYYMLIKHHRTSDTTAMKELLDKKIVVTPANIFFADQAVDTGYIRIHFALSKEDCNAVVKILFS